MQLQQTLSIALLSVLLFSCGGSLDGDTPENPIEPNTPTEPTVSVDMSVRLLDCPSGWNQNIALCSDTTEISEIKAGVVAVSLSQGEAALKSQIITATTSKGALQPNTVLTDSNGFAFFTLLSNSDEGAGRITLTTDAAKQETVSTLNFDIDTTDNPSPAVAVNLTARLLDCPSNWNQDVAQCTDTTQVSAIKPAVVAVSLRQGEIALKSQIITASASKGALLPDTALTDDNGIAFFTLVSNSDEGAGSITLTADAAEQNTTSTINFDISVSNVEIAIENNTAGLPLAQNSTALITVNLTTDEGGYASPVKITFSSACATAGTAKLDESVLTVGGVARATYKAIGCTGADVITANAEVNNLSASTTIMVASSPAHSIRYLGASPEWIALQGTGGVGRQETSTLTFKLVDKNGLASSQQVVDFTLDTFPPGTVIAPPTATTNTEGEVSTVISAGKIPGPVVLSAKLKYSDPIISTVSDQLIISTGLADQDSFTLALENFAPETWEYAGDKYRATVYLADHENNTVPDGTAVSFQTEGGSVSDADGQTGSCNTTAGECVVYWKAQNPKPLGNKLSDKRDGELQHGCAYSLIDAFAPCINSNGMGQPYGGRVTITAYAVGEESFVDNDNDGWFTAGDNVRLTANEDGPVQDLPEVFFDYNEDGKYKTNTNAVSDQTEESKDFNPVDGLYSAANGIFNGRLCSKTEEALGNCSTELIHIRRSGHFIMASSNQKFRVRGTVDVSAIVSNIQAAKANYTTAVTNLNIAKDNAADPAPTGAGTTTAIVNLTAALTALDAEVALATTAGNLLQPLSTSAIESANTEQLALAAVEAVVNKKVDGIPEVNDTNEKDAVTKTEEAEKAGVAAAKDALALDRAAVDAKNKANQVTSLVNAVTASMNALVTIATDADTVSAADTALAAMSDISVSLDAAETTISGIQSKLLLAKFIDTNTIDLTTATGSGAVTVYVYIADINNNRPPTGSTFEISTTNGVYDGEAPAALVNSSAYGPISFPVTLTREAEPNKKSVGTLTIKLVTPTKGIVNTYTLSVSDDG